MEEKIKVIDDSGDRRFFTILPNFIANHSTSHDQALYFQMKRMAGEDGLCFATQQTLMKKMGVGIKIYRKSLKYILDKKWVEYIGMTGGKTRPVKTYKIIDIWQTNNEFYTQNQKISAESTLSNEKILYPKNTKISAESTIEEEPLKEEPIENPLLSATGSPFNLKDEIQKLKQSPQRHIQLIGEFLEEKKVLLENATQLKRAVKRHLRAARELADFSDKQIAKASEQAERDYPKIWQLETLIKLITK